MAEVRRALLPWLVEGVRAWFSDNAIDASIVLGWKERTKQANQGPGGAARVVFSPSDDSGKGGKLSQDFGNRGPGGNPRPLVMWERTCVVAVWARDPDAPGDDEGAIEAVETLLEQVVQAVQAVAGNSARWGEVLWTVSPNELSFGRELRASLTLRGPLFDRTSEIATPSPVITRA